MSNLTPFHVAIPVYDLDQTRSFYRDILQCEEGRSSDQWVDLNFFGHQFVLHMKPRPAQEEETHHNQVEGHDVPVPHYGVVLEWGAWEALRDRLMAHQTQFVIAPYLRFEGEPGEQATMFFLDPSGNALEFKAFKDMGQLFAK